MRSKLIWCISYDMTRAVLKGSGTQWDFKFSASHLLRKNKKERKQVEAHIILLSKKGKFSCCPCDVVFALIRGRHDEGCISS